MKVTRYCPFPITKKILQQDMPDWTWEAERESGGFGWRYVGVKTGRSPVSVRACAVLHGPTEDVYTTEWYVTDGKESLPYVIWALRRAVTEPTYSELWENGPDWKQKAGKRPAATDEELDEMELLRAVDHDDRISDGEENLNEHDQYD